MGYQRSILQRWSRRDWLTVVIVAATTAFLVGTTLLLLTTGAHIATVSNDLETSTTATHYGSIDDAREATDKEAIIFPITEVRDETGTEYTIVGIPPNAPNELPNATTSWEAATIPPPSSPQTIRGPVSEDREVQFTEYQDNKTITVVPHQNNTIFPSWWYTANSSTVKSLGPTGAIAIDSGSETNRESTILPSYDRLSDGVPLVSALAFLLAGMNEVLQLLAVATVGGAIIVMVVLYSVTRINVQERLESIEIIRSTGGTPTRVLLLFGLRSTLVSLVGILSGFLIGVVLTNLSITFATWVGISITLDPRLTPAVLRVLIPMLVTLVAVSCLAGVFAARPAAMAPPTTLQSQTGSRPTSAVIQHVEPYLPSSLSPILLDWRTVVPTASTLTVFVLLVLLVSGIAAAIAPLSATGAGTITSAGASHPLDSRLDAETADALQANGIEASPEIVLAQVNNGQPYLARGANYSDFAAVTDAELVKGHKPTAPDEAVIGHSLAKTQDITVGETITLGGSDNPAVARVTVVGVYEAGGLVDDQLVVPLETAHHLSVKPGTVHVIRTEGNANAIFNGSNGNNKLTNENIVQEINSPETASLNKPTTIAIHLQNDKSTVISRSVTISIGQESYNRQVRLKPGDETRIEINHTFSKTGNQTVNVQNRSRTISVRSPNMPTFPTTLPEKAPPGATILVPVTTPTGEAVSNATVVINGNETTTSANGVARIELPETEGTYTLTTVKAGQNRATHKIQIIDGQERQLGADLQIEPQTGTPETSPTVTITLVNHWSERQTQDVTIVSPMSEQTQPVTLSPNESMTMERTLAGSGSNRQTPPGEYEISVTTNGDSIATETYEVLDGDFNLETIPEGAQYKSGAAVGQAIENTVGNIQILLVTIVTLAGLMTIGSTTAVFAQAVHTRHEAIRVHRSTGARPIQVLRIVIADACKLAIPATILAMAAALIALYLLDIVGALSIFGIRLMTELQPVLLLLMVIGAIIIAVCSAVLALLPVLYSPPSKM